jgi:(p)ppGpp synthase/HD superfamily hydrolase
MKQMLNAALKFAAEKHDGQYDKAGMPYIFHVLKVMHYLKTDDEELMCIAVLHDVIEDTNATRRDLQDIGMTDRVMKAVHLLTKRENEPNDLYLKFISMNKDAILVKMADLRHNMDIRRLKGVTEKDLQRLAKYAKSYEYLKEALKEF